MATTDRECPACGKRALSIATRCPRCGEEFPARPVRWQASRDPRRLRPLPTAAVVLLVAVGLFSLAARRGLARDRELPATGDVRGEASFALDTARAAASPVMPVAVLRVARTWTKVHDRRSAKADVAAVLLPGDTVLADSLRGGWWRVALEGRVVGYVYARTLLGD